MSTEAQTVKKVETLSDKLAKMGSEDFPNSPVPMKERVTWPYLTVAWFGAAMFVGLYYAGVELGTHMGNISRALTAIFFGAVFLSTFVALHGIVGQKTGCNAALTGTFAFGSKGVMIPGFHIADIGWYIVMTAQFVFILHTIFPQVDIRVYASIFSLLYLTNSFVGFRQMARLNMVAMPILLFVGLFGLYRISVLTDGGLGAIFQKTYPNDIPIKQAITIVVGTWISGSSRAADYFRWAKKPSDAVKAAYAGFFTGFVICIVVGAFWGAGTGSTNIGETLAFLGIIPLGLLMFGLQTWTTNEHSGYVTSCALPVAYKAVTGKKASRRRIIAGLAIFSMLVSGLGIEKYYIPFISFLGIFIPVIGSIVLADYFIMSKTKYHWTGHEDYYSMNVNDEDVQHHKMNWAVVPALIGGFLFGWKSTWGIGAVNSLFGTAIIYCICCLLFAGMRRKEKEKNAALANKGL